MIGRQQDMWSEVDDLIQIMKAPAYDKALAILLDLKTIAEIQEQLSQYWTQIDELAVRYKTKQAMLRRMRDAALVGRKRKA